MREQGRPRQSCSLRSIVLAVQEVLCGIRSLRQGDIREEGARSGSTQSTEQSSLYAAWPHINSCAAANPQVRGCRASSSYKPSFSANFFSVRISTVPKDVAFFHFEDVSSLETKILVVGETELTAV